LSVKIKLGWFISTIDGYKMQQIRFIFSYWWCNVSPQCVHLFKH